MTDDGLVRLYEHNNWANERLFEICAGLTDEQLDASPLSTTDWSIRRALVHIAQAQQGYLSVLTRPLEERPLPDEPPPPYETARELARTSGEGLLALARDAAARPTGRIESRSGHAFEPWIPLCQVINHATDHRRQIGDMLRAQGLQRPNLDLWSYGTSLGAMTSPEG